MAAGEFFKSSTWNTAACWRLGVYHQHGKGVEQNDTEALKWYTSAADQGNHTYQLHLANRYRWGEGVEQSATKVSCLSMEIFLVRIIVQ